MPPLKYFEPNGISNFSRAGRNHLSLVRRIRYWPLLLQLWRPIGGFHLFRLLGRA
jgi:hypothetical protein